MDEIKQKILKEATKEELKEAKEALEYAYKQRKKIKKVQDEIDKLGL